MSIAASTGNITAYQRQLLLAHKERQARMAAAARKAKRNAANSNTAKAEPAKRGPKPQTLPVKHKLVQVPLWKVTPQYFNQHVIDYRQYLLAFELQGVAAEDFEPAPVRPSMTQIAAEVLSDFPGVTLEELKGERRNRNIVVARQIAMYRIRCKRPDLSFPTIGRFFGGRDHTTVLHAVQKIERLMEAAE